MKIWRMLGFVVIASMFLAAGCNSVDQGSEGKDENPPPLDEMTTETVSGTPEDWNEGAETSSVSESPLDNLDVVAGLNFPTVYFAYDSDALASSESAKLDKVAKYLNDYPVLFLIVEGHCDQRGTEEYNRGLGERRANIIRQYLANAGVADSRVKTVSYGKDRPAAEGSGEAVWGKNRRGELLPAKKK